MEFLRLQKLKRKKSVLRKAYKGLSGFQGMIKAYKGLRVPSNLEVQSGKSVFTPKFAGTLYDDWASKVACAVEGESCASRGQLVGRLRACSESGRKKRKFLKVAKSKQVEIMLQITLITHVLS
jgi:hypothetical protein